MYSVCSPCMMEWIIIMILNMEIYKKIFNIKQKRINGFIIGLMNINFFK